MVYYILRVRYYIILKINTVLLGLLFILSVISCYISHKVHGFLGEGEREKRSGVGGGVRS